MTRENEALTEQNERFKALKNQFKEDAFKKVHQHHIYV